MKNMILAATTAMLLLNSIPARALEVDALRACEATLPHELLVADQKLHIQARSLLNEKTYAEIKDRANALAAEAKSCEEVIQIIKLLTVELDKSLRGLELVIKGKLTEN